jgi:hypothetical protein
MASKRSSMSFTELEWRERNGRVDSPITQIRTVSRVARRRSGHALGVQARSRLRGTARSASGLAGRASRSRLGRRGNRARAQSAVGSWARVTRALGVWSRQGRGCAASGCSSRSAGRIKVVRAVAGKQRVQGRGMREKREEEKPGDGGGG